MNAVVLITSSVPRGTRVALDRALERMPARVESCDLLDRAERLRAIAADTAVDVVVIVDDDAVVLPAAFASVVRALAGGPAIVGGQAHVNGVHRFGASFAAPRSGPDPFELVPVQGVEVNRDFLAAVRGPLDVPQRGVFLVDAAFVRALPARELDPFVLHLDLAVAARCAGRTIVCEPLLTFIAADDGPAVLAALGRHRRFAGLDCWAVESLHREPPALRARLVHREVRSAGDIRGYQRMQRPPVHVLVDVSGVSDAAAARRAAERLAPGGTVATFDGDGDAIRRRLAHTGDHYVLVADAATLPAAAEVDALIERVERSGRNALALRHATAPFGAALFHGRRVVGARSFAGARTDATIASAIRDLAAVRLSALGPDGSAVEPPARRLPALTSVDVIFLAVSKPEVTNQTVRALVVDPQEGGITAIIPAGHTTKDTLLAVFEGVTVVRDAVDPHLAASFNRALARCTGDAVLIVRDDVQLPQGAVAAMRRAFERLPRLGAVVPRLSGAGRPESLPEVTYQGMTEMQTFAERRALAFARESLLMDCATAPAILVRRTALETVGGFNERFAFTQFGIADFTRRLAAANYLVARCDDAFAHLFTNDVVDSALSELDRAPYLRHAYESHWAARTGFDPASDRVPMRADDVVVASDEEPVRVLVPIADAAEWQRFRPHLIALAATLRASDAIEIAIGLDGSFTLAPALADIRHVLVETNLPFEETLNVALEPVSDIETWRDARTRRVRLEGFERPGLADLDGVRDAESIRAAFVTAPA